MKRGLGRRPELMLAIRASDGAAAWIRSKKLLELGTRTRV